MPASRDEAMSPRWSHRRGNSARSFPGSQWITSGGSGGGLAAVDVKDLAGQKTGFARCQECDGVGDLLGSPDALQRHALSHRGLSIGAAGEAAQQLSVHRAGGDCIHAHAEGSAFERGCFGQPFDRMLAGDVQRGPAAPRLPIVDERLTMLPLP
jgi:hypothetical protein